MDVADPKFVEVYRARNLPEAHAVRIMLEEAGFRVQLDGELLQGVLGELPLGWVTAPRILVEESQVTAAREIIRRVDVPESTEPDQDAQVEETRCLSCGQVMGDGEPKCPSCGWSYEFDEEGSPRAEASQAASAGHRHAADGSRLPRSNARVWIVVLMCVLGFGFILIYQVLSSAEGAFERGLTALNRKDYDLAISCFSTVIGWQPRSFGAYYNRGLAHSEKGEYDEAIADHSQAISLHPKFTHAYLGRGYAYLCKDHHDRAIADFNECLRLAPDPVIACDAHFHRATAYQKKRLYDKAVADFSEATRLDPKSAHAYNSLAWLWATCPETDMRNGKKAVEYARKACELSNWKEPYFLDTLAAAYAECGEFDEAAEWQRKALDAPKSKHPAIEAEREEARSRLKLYQERKPYREE